METVCLIRPSVDVWFDWITGCHYTKPFNSLGEPFYELEMSCFSPPVCRVWPADTTWS